jgi:hypothetical protein
MNGAATPIPLHAFISCTRKVYFIYILYFSAVTVITYLNNIKRLVFIMENVVFSARQKLVLHNFAAICLCLKAFERSPSWFYSTGRKKFVGFEFSQQIGFWNKDLHIGGDRYEWADNG